MFPLHNNQYLRNISSQTGGSGPSPAIWQPVEAAIMQSGGRERATIHYDDFMNFGGAVASNVGNKNGYKTWEDTGGSIDQIVDVNGGVIKFLTDATDNDSNSMQGGFGIGSLGAISDTAGDDYMTAFEVRARFTQIGNTYGAVIGLGETAQAVDTYPIADDGTLVTNKGMIGFRVLEGAGATLQAFYIKSGQTAVAWTFKTLVAATWYKFGFLYNPRAKTANRIAWFLDGVEQATYVTGTQIATATFPDAVFMHLLAAMKNQTTAAQSFDMDFWGYAQVGLA